MLNKLKQINDKVWAWCKNSGTILLARSQALIGLLIAALGSLDWAPIVSLSTTTGFTVHQLITLGAVLIVQSIIYEIVRRRKSSTDPV